MDTGRRERDVIEGSEVRWTRAVCELCGEVITAPDGRRHTGLIFLPFERLLDLHMEQRHPNVCVLPIPSENRKAA
jgi:hypothetical protein